MITLTDLCDELNNYFPVTKFYGVFSIEGENIYFNEEMNAVPHERDTEIYDLLQDGQFFRIVGSVYNDGVYEAPAELKNEIFEGSIWAMAVPSNVTDLLKEINEWLEKYHSIFDSPYISESFGGYSYSKNSDLTQSGWQSVFSKRLNKWRKIRP
jgi:hypothetical protein